MLLSTHMLSASCTFICSLVTCMCFLMFSSLTIICLFLTFIYEYACGMHTCRFLLRKSSSSLLLRRRDYTLWLWQLRWWSPWLLTQYRHEQSAVTWPMQSLTEQTQRVSFNIIIIINICYRYAVSKLLWLFLFFCCDMLPSTPTPLPATKKKCV